MRCPACGASTDASARYPVAEFMLETGEVFHYEPCTACDSRVIVDPPADLGRYYPLAYAAFAGRNGRVLRLRRRLGFDDRVRAFARLRAPATARLLDAGCGSGDFLRALEARGYRDLTGVDPFLPFDAHADGACRFVRGGLSALRGERFDVVTMHHVVEHAPDTRQFLTEAAAVLAPGGRLLVRTPLVDSWAARTYGARWVQHDAPRHLVVLSSAGLGRAAAAAGLRITASWRDEMRWHAWAAATLAEGRNPLRPVGLATKAARFAYSRAARGRNRLGTGDQGCFVLEHARPAEGA